MCLTCEDYCAICKLCRRPGTKCQCGKRFKAIACPTCSVKPDAVLVRRPASAKPPIEPFAGPGFKNFVGRHPDGVLIFLLLLIAATIAAIFNLRN